MELIRDMDCSFIIPWEAIDCGTMVEVNWPEALTPKYRKFEAPFIGVDSRGFIVLEVGVMDYDLDLYDGFPPGVCRVK